MKSSDPILETEHLVKKMHDGVGKYTQPILHRYPLLFSFLIFFGLAATLNGFELLTDRIELFQRHPLCLISIGLLILFLTGMLYKSLGRK